MQEKDFVTYEYKTVSVKAKDQAKAMDMYEAFGWEITSCLAQATGGVNLSLRRDRKQRHKAELNKLERQAEETFESLDRLEKSKKAGPSVFSYLFGIAASLILGGGMCFVMLSDKTAAFIIGTLLGIVGIALCGVNYVIYSKLVAKKTKEVLPVIDETEEKLANILERGNDLLRTELL